MAQSVSKWPKGLLASNVAVSVAATGNTTLLEFIADDLVLIGVSILPTVQALDAFIIQVKLHPDDAYLTMFSAAGDYTTPAGLMEDASGDLTGLAAAATGWFIMDVRPVYAI